MTDSKNFSSPATTWGDSNFEDVSVEQLDKAFSEYVEARNVYEEKNKASKEAYAKYQDLEFKFISILQHSGKTNWNVDGLGKCSEYERKSYATPKTTESKQEIAKYIQDNHGKDAFWDMFSINSATLNAFCKQEIENNPGVKIPGLGEPTAIKKLRLTRSKK